jgi:hypothetical protein
LLKVRARLTALMPPLSAPELEQVINLVDQNLLWPGVASGVVLSADGLCSWS